VARMIPATISQACASGGEREIFARLRDEPHTENWIVLHSLDIASHVRQVSGEADFLIIVPSLGALCLEVKACSAVRRSEGMWYYGTDHQGEARGPFRQASEAMHSLRQRLLSCSPSLSRVPFWSAVTFPYVDFAISSGEWHPWQVIDGRMFRRHPFSILIKGVLRQARCFLSDCPATKWFRDQDHLPTEAQASTIAECLRPSFESFEKPSDRRARQQCELAHYTEEQYAALDAMAANQRVLFTGPAGTGKTVLAVEAARRGGADGDEVLLLCFNRLLGRWLSEQQCLQASTVQAKTLHQYMLRVAGVQPGPDAHEDFWSRELPERAISKLLDDHADLGRYRLIIVDEAQDILRPEYLDVLDLILKGGLAAGRWLFFGDFERQMLYDQDGDELQSIIESRLGGTARFELRVNCRNTPRIAAFSHLLGRMDPGYSRVLRPDDQLEPQICYYAKPSQQSASLVRVLDTLYADSFSGSDVVVLSTKAPPRCVAATVGVAPWRDRLAPYGQASQSQGGYTTVHSFKGLEAPAVVVTDIEHLDNDHFCSLFYVATTRALHRLHILVHEAAKQSIVKALISSTPETK